MLMRYIRVLSELGNQLRYASQKRVLIEVALIKLTKPSMEPDLESLLERVSQLEEALEDLEAGRKAGQLLWELQRLKADKARPEYRSRQLPGRRAHLRRYLPNR